MGFLQTSHRRCLYYPSAQLMKHVIKLKPKHYVHLDSYGESHETRGSEVIVLALGILISALTVGALLGTDITQPTQQNHGNSHRTDR